MINDKSFLYSLNYEYNYLILFSIQWTKYSVWYSGNPRVGLGHPNLLLDVQFYWKEQIV